MQCTKGFAITRYISSSPTSTLSLSSYLFDKVVVRYFESNDMAAQCINCEAVLHEESMFRCHKQRHDHQRSLVTRITCIWSAVDRTHIIPCTHDTFGDHSFTVAGQLQLDISYRQFKRQIKTGGVESESESRLWPKVKVRVGVSNLKEAPGPICLIWTFV